MLVSESHRFLFIHVPRTGGTSIQEALEPFSTEASTSRFNKMASKMALRTWNRRHFPVHTALLSASRSLPRGIFQDLFKFAFVRNPWARLASDYAYKMANPGHRRHRETVGLGGFEAWLNQEAGKERSSQLAMLGQDLDFQGRFESLSEDFGRICERLGLEVQLGHLNRARPSAWDWRELYDAATRSLVGECWAEEIEELCYVFED